MDEAHEMLHKIHGELIEFRSETKIRSRHVQDLLDDHHTALYGDGNGKPGLRMRTDRLEQRAKRGEKHFWTLWIAAVGAAATAVFSWFNKP